jgi:hypothetical protein
VRISGINGSKSLKERKKKDLEMLREDKQKHRENELKQRIQRPEQELEMGHERYTTYPQRATVYFGEGRFRRDENINVTMILPVEF